MTAPSFSGLTFAAPTVGAPTASTGVLGLTAGTMVAGILDPVSTQRVFNPIAEGNPVASGDTAAHWLPTVKSVSAATVTDNLQAGSPVEVGQITLQLTPAAANTVEAPSVMTFKLSPGAVVLTVTGGTF